MVSEDGRNYKFSPVQASKSPMSYRNGVDDKLKSFVLRAQSLTSTTNDKADIMITMPKPWAVEEVHG